MEKESTLALFKQLESDVKTCLEKDLDTNEEFKKQKAFTNNFTAMLDFLVKLNAPSGLQNDIKGILKLIGEWDVYAYWFKEMKDLVAKIKGFMSSFTSFAEGAGIIPKAQKPVEKPASPPVEKPGAQPPAKPVAPSLLKPIVMGASPQKPSPPSLPAVTFATKPAAKAEAASAPDAKERAVPLLKPVFKMPAVKPTPGTAASPSSPQAAPAPHASRPAEAPAIDASSTPVPLKALVDEKKLEIHVKPVKLIKPILAVQHAAPAVEEVPKKGEPPAKPAVPVLGSRTAVSAAPKPAVTPSPKPAGAEKPLLIPKPIKIVVPDLDNIDFENEIGGDKPGSRPATTAPPSPEEGGDMFGDIDVIEGSIPVRTPPARVVKPIPVKIQPGKSAVADPNDEIVDNVVAKVSQRLDARKPTAQKAAPAPVKKPAPPEDEFITPMEVSPEDIDEWAVDEEPKAAPSPSPAKPGAARKKDVVEMLDAAESWDDEQISSILGEAMDEGTPAPPTGAAGKGKTPGPVTLKPAVSAFVPESEEGDGEASIGVIDQEPKKTRLQDIKKTEAPAPAAPAAAPETVDSMSLFMGGLGSKRNDKKPATQSPGFSLFHPSGKAEAPAPAASTIGTAKAQTKQQHSPAPIGSDVDVETLPDTKDGLYQALIALEGKRYAIERARKDLRADLDKGIIKAPAYEQKLADLKGEMDKIADKIKEIREKIKKFK